MSVIQTCFITVIFQLWQYNNIIIDIFRCHLIFLYITFASFFFLILKNIHFSYKFVCYLRNCNCSFIFACFHISLASWVIYTHLDTLLKTLYLVLISVPQESNKGETGGKKRSEHIWVKNPIFEWNTRGA
jgi:hypothetical protein